MAKKAPKQPPIIARTINETYVLKRPRKGAKLKEEVWQTEDGRVVKYSLAYIHPEICGPDNGRVLGYDNSHEYHHRHFLGTVEPVEFENYKDLAERFHAEVKELWRKEDEKTGKNASVKKAVDVKVTTGTVEDFFKRSVGRARKLDRDELLPAEIRLTFEDPADLVRALSVQRIRVLHTVRLEPAKPTPISGLAAILKRDRKAVSRDVKVLESLGLVKTHDKPNPGHGMMKVVQPLAKKYHLLATI